LWEEEEEEGSLEKMIETYQNAKEEDTYEELN